MYILDRGLGDIFSSKDGDSNTGNKLVDASANGNLQEVKRLTEEEQLDPEQGVGKNEVNALHEAAVTGHLDVLRYFIEERGCNAACMSVGGTPLHYAAMKNHLHIVQYLIEMQQVEPFIRSHNDGSTALQCACYGGSIDVIHYLAKEMSKYLPLKDIVEDRDRKGYRPLHETALFGHLEATKFLITELNADPNGTNDSGVLPLHFAVYGGHLEVVKYLIEHHQKHCDPSCRLNKDPRGWHGRLLLETAHKCGHHHIVEYLESVID